MQRRCKFQQALHRVTLKVETCSGTLKLTSKFVVPVSVSCSVTRPSEVSLSGVVRWNSWFYRQCNGCDRCKNRQQFYYFTLYLPCNESSKRFHETDHVARCRNACWNLFRSAIAHKFLLNVKPLLHVETLRWNLCTAQRPLKLVSQGRFAGPFRRAVSHKFYLSFT